MPGTTRRIAITARPPIPFIYAKAGELPAGYVSGQGKSFQPAEAQVIAERLGEAVISFGAKYLLPSQTSHPNS